MKVISVTKLISSESQKEISEYNIIESEIINSIKRMVWPLNSNKFTIYPQSGKKRGEGNGVKPIKDNFVNSLISKGWEKEIAVSIIPGKRFGKFDIFKNSNGFITVVEWETGNISSSHRSVNKMVLALLKKKINAGFLILPSRDLYKYLTDRVGNFQELQPYFDLWKSVDVDGFLTIIEIEYDATSTSVPRIPKGTDGRAIV